MQVSTVMRHAAVARFCQQRQSLRAGEMNDVNRRSEFFGKANQQRDRLDLGLIRARGEVGRSIFASPLPSQFNLAVATVTGPATSACASNGSPVPRIRLERQAQVCFVHPRKSRQSRSESGST